ncbi:MAG: methylenetetrahydrofolate reductase [Pseudomonadota bacterium]
MTSVGAIFDDKVGAYSAEITANDKKTLSKAASMMSPGAPIYIAALPKSSAAELIEKAEHARSLGLDPIPHLVARNYASAEELKDCLGALQQRAKNTKALVLGGDRDDPAGPFDSALQLIETGYLQEYGVHGISVGCYPEGHPRISDEVLAQALRDKIDASEKAGLAVRLITQICFDADVILDFVRSLRRSGIHAPLRVGVVGPTKFSTLFKYAVVCGVGPSLRSLSERRDLHKKLLTGYRPDDIVRAISAASHIEPDLGIVGAHFFTFGSLSKSVEWLSAEDMTSLQFSPAPKFDWDQR